MDKKRVLAGMRASGKLHLGNYLGGAKGMLALQNDPTYETMYMVADLHGVTTPYDKNTFAESTRNIILDYLAAGLDPEKSVLFIDSHVPEVTELAFLLSSSVTIARMQHLPTFKEKVKQYPEGSTMALLNYPVLMAADILAYKADLVPVGIDQEPHLEISREIARKMNSDYGTDFPEPQRFKTEGEYIFSLVGEGKMSKSVEGSYISLNDDLSKVKERLAKVPTDSGRGDIKYFEKTEKYAARKMYVSESGTEAKGLYSLMQLVEIFQGRENREEFEQNYTEEGIRYKDLKEGLAEDIFKELKPIQKQRTLLEEDPSRIERILKEGAEKARAIAKDTVKEVKEKMGFLVS